ALTMWPNDRMDALFEATVGATEEAIVNAMVAARTMTGFRGYTVPALPHDRLPEILRRHQRLEEKRARRGFPRAHVFLIGRCRPDAPLRCALHFVSGACSRG